MKILVVEDDAVLAIELCETLEYVGHEAEWTINADGLKRLVAQHGWPDALISDGHLAHGQTGIDVYEWCKEGGFDMGRFILHTGDRAFAERFEQMYPGVIICHKMVDHPEKYLPQPMAFTPERKRA